MSAGLPTFDGKKFSKIFLLASFMLSLTAILWLVRSFLLQVLLAVIIAILLHPLYRFFLRLTRGRQSLSSMLCCIVVVFALFLPLAVTAQLVIDQGIDLYHATEAQIRDISRQGNAGIIGTITDSRIGQWFALHQITVNWESVLTRAVNYMGSTLAGLINTMSRATVTVVFDLFIILFSLFYFLRDGERMLHAIKDVIPISERYRERIIEQFYVMTNAIVRGIVLIALIQSLLATFTLWAFGINAWLLWGFVMLVFSVIPFAGTGVVLVPAGIIKIVSGDIWQGIAIMAISIFFISTIDNILRPRIVGRHAGMHNLLVFLSMIGGILSFGPIGLIVGPLIAAMFLSILEIYKIEFQPHIESMRHHADQRSHDSHAQ